MTDKVGTARVRQDSYWTVLEAYGGLWFLDAMRAVVPRNELSVLRRPVPIEVAVRRRWTNAMLGVAKDYFKEVVTIGDVSMDAPQVSWEESYEIYQSGGLGALSNDPICKARRALFVTDDAPPEVIRAAYKALAKKYHSDVGGDDGDMIRINNAFDLLRDNVES